MEGMEIVFLLAALLAVMELGAVSGKRMALRQKTGTPKNDLETTEENNPKTTQGFNPETTPI